jgi:hypothetical protein
MRIIEFAFADLGPCRRKAKLAPGYARERIRKSSLYDILPLDPVIESYRAGMRCGPNKLTGPEPVSRKGRVSASVQGCKIRARCSEDTREGLGDRIRSLIDPRPSRSRTCFGVDEITNKQIAE